jgi:hypothetical protein
VDLLDAGKSGLMVKEQTWKEQEGGEAMFETLKLCEMKKRTREWMV